MSQQQERWYDLTVSIGFKPGTQMRDPSVDEFKEMLVDLFNADGMMDVRIQDVPNTWASREAVNEPQDRGGSGEVQGRGGG